MISKNSEKKEKSVQNETMDFSTRFGIFLRRYRLVFLVIAILAALSVIIVIGWTVINNIYLERSATAVEKIENQFDEWYSADETKRVDIEAALLSEIEKTQKSFKNSFASIRALLIKGQLYYEKENYSEAMNSFLDAYQEDNKSDVGVTGLRNAASCALATGDTTKGIELFEVLVNEVSISFSFAHDSWLLGMLYEENKNYAKAKECYGKLIAIKPNDDWTKLAKSRMIFLNSNGL